MKTIIDEKYENEVKNLSERLKSDGVQYLIFLNDGKSRLCSINASPKEIISMILEALESKLKPKEIMMLLEVARNAVAVRHTMESED